MTNMSVSTVMAEIKSNEFFNLVSLNLFTTQFYIQNHPFLKDFDPYSNAETCILLGRTSSYLLELLFDQRQDSLKYFVSGDYHHPNGIEIGIDPDGYLYEGFLSPGTTLEIVKLLKNYSRKKIVDDLKEHHLEVNIDYNEDDVKELMELIDFLRKVAQRENAVAILVA